MRSSIFLMIMAICLIKTYAGTLYGTAAKDDQLDPTLWVVQINKTSGELNFLTQAPNGGIGSIPSGLSAFDQVNNRLMYVSYNFDNDVEPMVEIINLTAPISATAPRSLVPSNNLECSIQYDSRHDRLIAVTDYGPYTSPTSTTVISAAANSSNVNDTMAVLSSIFNWQPAPTTISSGINNADGIYYLFFIAPYQSVPTLMLFSTVAPYSYKVLVLDCKGGYNPSELFWDSKSRSILSISTASVNGNYALLKIDPSRNTCSATTLDSSVQGVSYTTFDEADGMFYMASSAASSTKLFSVDRTGGNTKSVTISTSLYELEYSEK